VSRFARVATNTYSVAHEMIRRAAQHAPSIIAPLCMLAGLPASLEITIQVLAAQARHEILKQVAGYDCRIGVLLIIIAAVLFIATCLVLQPVIHTLSP
jgi:hypothetical protein